MNQFVINQGSSGIPASRQIVSVVEWIMKEGVDQLNTPSGKVTFLRKIISAMAQCSPIHTWGLTSIKECVKFQGSVSFPDLEKGISFETRVVAISVLQDAAPMVKALAFWLRGAETEKLNAAEIYLERKLFLTKDETIVGIDFFHEVEPGAISFPKRTGVRIADDAYLQDIFSQDKQYFPWVLEGLVELITNSLNQARRRIADHQAAQTVSLFTSDFFKKLHLEC